jgi:hypothetical protein
VDLEPHAVNVQQQFANRPAPVPQSSALTGSSQVSAHELEGWKRGFLEAGSRGLKSRSDPEARELTLARAKVGELTMRLELAEYLIEKWGLMDEWKRRKG